MHVENQKGNESQVSKDSVVRRTFLKRATAGVVVASIPGRSARAGIAGSIVASGHGSDFNQGNPTVLLGACAVASMLNAETFSLFFNNIPISPIANQPDLSAKSILEDGDPDPSNVNGAILIMLFNAVNSGYNGIFYPVLSQHNNGPTVFASYLYTQASAYLIGVANLLWSTKGANSAQGSTTTCPPA
jgi:hypothetical protein